MSLSKRTMLKGEEQREAGLRCQHTSSRCAVEKRVLTLPVTEATRQRVMVLATPDACERLRPWMK